MRSDCEPNRSRPGSVLNIGSQETFRSPAVDEVAGGGVFVTAIRGVSQTNDE